MTKTMTKTNTKTKTMTKTKALRQLERRSLASRRESHCWPFCEVSLAKKRQIQRQWQRQRQIHLENWRSSHWVILWGWGQSRALTLLQDMVLLNRKWQIYSSTIKFAQTKKYAQRVKWLYAAHARFNTSPLQETASIVKVYCEFTQTSKANL